MTVQALAKHSFSERPRLTSTDRLIERSEHETRYVPSGLVPDQIDVKLYEHYIECNFEYPIQETQAATQQTHFPNIAVVLGRYTEKILSLRIEFTPRDFNALLSGLRDAVPAVKRLKGRPYTKEVTQKSYDIIIGFIEDITKKVLEKREEVVKAYGSPVPAD